MYKIAALALTGVFVTATAVIGTQLSQADRSSATSASAGEAPATRQSPAHPDGMAAHASQHGAPPPPTTVAHAQTHGASTDEDPVDCATVARHLVEMATDVSDLPADPAVREQALHGGIEMIESRCTQEHWSPEYMTCVLGAPDPYSAHLDCAPYASHSDDQAAAPMSPGSFVIDGAEVTVPPTTDTTCAGVGKHIAKLAKVDDTKLTSVPAAFHDRVIAGMERARATMASQAAEACEQTAWTEERRACIAAATAVSIAHRCM